MLTREQLRGLWVSVLTEWDTHGEFDERTFREQIAMLIEARPHGLYTTGSTGEFYALDWGEWCRVTDVFLKEAAGKIPVQVGCNWFNTRDTIRRVQYARDRGADAVQICFPSWMPMRPEDYDQFLIDIYQAVPDIPIIHYNIHRTKKLFRGKDYARILPHVPTLIGSKAGMSLDEYMELVVNAPAMHHFVGELTFPLAHLMGCPGMYTSWFMMNPTFFHDYYRKCIDGRYDEAVPMMMRMALWFDRAVRPLIEKGYMDPALDKAFVEMAGWLPGNRLTRKPYHPVSDEDFAFLRRVTAELMPEFLEYRP